MLSASCVDSGQHPFKLDHQRLCCSCREGINQHVYERTCQTAKSKLQINEGTWKYFYSTQTFRKKHLSIRQLGHLLAPHYSLVINTPTDLTFQVVNKSTWLPKKGAAFLFCSYLCCSTSIASMINQYENNLIHIKKVLAEKHFSKIIQSRHCNPNHTQSKKIAISFDEPCTLYKSLNLEPVG